MQHAQKVVPSGISETSLLFITFLCHLDEQRSSSSARGSFSPSVNRLDFLTPPGIIKAQLTEDFKTHANLFVGNKTVNPHAFFSSTSANTLPSPEAPAGPIPCSSFSATQVSLGPARGGRKLTNKTPNLTSTAPNVKPHTAQGCHFTPQLNRQPLFEGALYLLPSSFPPPVITAPPVSMKRFGDLYKQQKINF